MNNKINPLSTAIMKIYVVTHFYDNGESYEDYREYIEYAMFSTEDNAYAFYCEKILSDYEGRYSVFEWELDTQEKVLLEESPWVKCSSMYRCDDWQGDYEPEYNPEDYYPNPMESYKEYWRWDNYTSYEDISEEEDRAWFEYVNTPSTNYHKWEEVNKEIEERKNAILLNELDELLKELC